MQLDVDAKTKDEQGEEFGSERLGFHRDFDYLNNIVGKLLFQRLHHTDLLRLEKKIMEFGKVYPVEMNSTAWAFSGT